MTSSGNSAPSGRVLVDGKPITAAERGSDVTQRRLLHRQERAALQPREAASRTSLHDHRAATARVSGIRLHLRADSVAPRRPSRPDETALVEHRRRLQQVVGRVDVEQFDARSSTSNSSGWSARTHLLSDACSCACPCREQRPQRRVAAEQRLAHRRWQARDHRRTALAAGVREQLEQRRTRRRACRPGRPAPGVRPPARAPRYAEQRVRRLFRLDPDHRPLKLRQQHSALVMTATSRSTARIARERVAAAAAALQRQRSACHRRSASRGLRPGSRRSAGRC